MLRNKTFAPEFCSLISNWFDMREQAPGINLLHESVSGASSLVCTEIYLSWHDVSPFGQSNWLFFLVPMLQLGCFSFQLPRRFLRVYWLGYLPGSVFLERVSGESSLVCTGLKCDRAEKLMREQGWRSGESARLPLMWPGFDSYSAPKVFLRVLRFSSLHKNQHFQIPIRSGNSGWRVTSWKCHCKFVIIIIIMQQWKLSVCYTVKRNTGRQGVVCAPASETRIKR